VRIFNGTIRWLNIELSCYQTKVELALELQRWSWYWTISLLCSLWG